MVASLAMSASAFGIPRHDVGFYAELRRGEKQKEEHYLASFVEQAGK